MKDKKRFHRQTKKKLLINKVKTCLDEYVETYIPRNVNQLSPSERKNEVLPEWEVRGVQMPRGKPGGTMPSGDEITSGE